MGFHGFLSLLTGGLPGHSNRHVQFLGVFNPLSPFLALVYVFREE